MSYKVKVTNLSTGLDCDDVLLVQDLGCVLPVDLYDTTGEHDIHLNEEVVNIQAFYQTERSKTCELEHLGVGCGAGLGLL